MKTILVPTDFSEYSQKAIQVAVNMAKSTRAKVVLLHNIHTETNWKVLSPSAQKKYPETLTRIRKADDRLCKLLSSPPFKNVKVTYEITFGVAYGAIVNAAKRIKADLVVIGSHGNEGSERFFIGSTIQKVLRQATCPVLTVKKDAHYGNWKKLVFAADLYGKIEKPFREIMRLAKALNTIIHLVVVNRPTDFLTTRDAHNKMDEFIKKCPDLRFQKVLYCHYSVEDGVMEYAEDIKADWIALITHNRRWKPGYLIGNTETLVYRSPVPILSANILPEPLK